MHKYLRMPSLKYKYLYFLNFLIIFFIFNVKCFSQTIDKSNLRVDTLKAIWTSGFAPFQIKGKIYLSFKIPGGKQGDLFMKRGTTGSYTKINTFGDVLTNTTQQIRTEIPDLNIRNEIYCFYISVDNGGPVVSQELCSVPIIKLPNISPEGKIVFRVGSYQPATSETFRPRIVGKCISDFGCKDDEEEFATNSRPALVEKPVGTKVKCGEIKVYQITTQVEGMITISDTIKSIGFIKQIPPKLIDSWVYATVEDNGNVKLLWQNNDVINDSLIAEKRFIIERKDGINGNYVKLPQDPSLERTAANASTTKWSFTDPATNAVKTQYFYKLSYEDYCSNISLSSDANPIFLSQDKDKGFPLVWNNDNNSKVADYEVEYISTNKPVEITNTLIIQPKANIYKAQTANYYRIKGRQIGGDGKYIYSNLTPNDEKIDVLAPSVFTPDGDIHNNEFKVFAVGAATFKIHIYNRAGLLVYFSDNPEQHKKDGWDGKIIYTNIECEEGQYVFQALVTNSNGRVFSKKGNFLLVRNKR